MRYAFILFSIWFMVLPGAGAEALYIQQGLHGMRWGSSVADYHELAQVHQKGQAVFYVRSQRLYHAANQRIPRVSYGFYRDQLYAAFIKLRSADQFAHLARQFTEKHGDSKISYEDAGRQVIYRWKVADVKIKLKIKNSDNEFKLAFYYSPLADTLNREQLEQLPEDAYGPSLLGEPESADSDPLLDY